MRKEGSAMSWFRKLRLVAFVAVTVAFGSCTLDSAPTGPAQAEDPDLLLGSLLRPTGLLDCRVESDASASATIGREGGSLRVGRHVLWVPAGALSEPVTISAVAPAGKHNVVQFAPHGLRFERPVYLTMSYANCNTLGKLLPKRIAYTTDLLDILEYLLSFDNLWAERVTGRVDHFSTYVVAW